MDLLLAIRNYTDKLMEYGYYPKTKKPSIGKLEKMADLCYDGKIRKITRYIPKDAPSEIAEELNNLVKEIERIINEEKNSQ